MDILHAGTHAYFSCANRVGRPVKSAVSDATCSFGARRFRYFATFFAALAGLLALSGEVAAQEASNKFKYMDWTVTCTPSWCNTPANRAFDTAAEAVAYAWESYTRKDGYEIKNYYPGYDYVCGPATPTQNPPSNSWGYWVVAVVFEHAWCRWRNQATGQLEDNASLGNGNEGVWSDCEPGAVWKNMPDGYGYCAPNSTCLSSGACRLKQIDAPNICSIGNPTLPGTGVKLHSETDVAGQGFHSLRVERHYRSFLHDSSGGALGRYWTTSWHRRLIQGFDFDYPLAVMRDGGAIRRFTVAGNSYVAEAGVMDRLQRIVDAGGSTVGWRLTNLDENALENYDAAGRLSSIAWHDGRVATLLQLSEHAIEYSAGPGISDPGD